MMPISPLNLAPDTDLVELPVLDGTAMVPLGTIRTLGRWLYREQRCLACDGPLRFPVDGGSDTLGLHAGCEAPAWLRAFVYEKLLVDADLGDDDDDTLDPVAVFEATGEWPVFDDADLV